MQKKPSDDKKQNKLVVEESKNSKLSKYLDSSAGIRTQKAKHTKLVQGNKVTLIDDSLLKRAYESHLKDAKTPSTMFQDSKKGFSTRKRSNVKNKSVPYGFRTSDMYNSIKENLEKVQTKESDQSRAQTLYTDRLQKEYYSNDGYVPTSKIYDSLFRPALNDKPTNKLAQQELTDRLMNHTDKIRFKNKLNEISQDMKVRDSMKPESESQGKSRKAKNNLSADYKMYEHQMQMELKRKVC